MKRSKARLRESIEFAREQRRFSNEFADTVWHWLRNRKCHGLKFRCEVPIPPYTADFCCVENKLIIEIDGQPHLTADGIAHDQARDVFLQKLGYRILRVPGYEVIREDGKARDLINRFVAEQLSLRSESPSPPTPLPAAGRGE